jgi:hypothetical protein|tara:strand:+ start:735 stop:947 length:213 start_codon:yes stop_codon:yes gene_type:complete
MFTTLSIIQWLLLGGVAIVGFLLGRDTSRHEAEKVIEATIMTLIKKRFVKAELVDGEYELYEYDEKIITD